MFSRLSRLESRSLSCDSAFLLRRGCCLAWSKPSIRMPGAGEDGLCVPSMFFFRFLLLPFASAPAFLLRDSRRRLRLRNHQPPAGSGN